MQHAREPVDVGHVEADRRLVQDVERSAGAGRAPRRALGQLGDQLDALRLAAAQRRAGLPHLQVPQPHFHQQAQGRRDARVGGEHLGRRRRVERQHVGNRSIVDPHRQRLLIEASAAARLAADRHVRQEAHLQPLHPLARARRAPAAVDVEGEAAGAVAADARLGGGGEQGAHLVPDPHVGGRAGARRLADRRLVDLQGAAQRLPPFDRAAADPRGARRAPGAARRARRQPFAHLIEQQPARQGALARAAHAGDAGDRRQGDAHVHAAQVVQRRLPDGQPAGVGIAPPLDDRMPAGRAQHPAGGGGVARHHLGQAAVRDQPAALGTASRTEVDDVIGAPDRLLVVLHHHDGIAPLLQPPQGSQQQMVVARVHADRRLIQHVADAAELRSELRGQPDALRLAAAQGRRRAVQTEVAQSHLMQEPQARVQLAGDVARDRPLPVVERQGAQRGRQRLHRQAAQIVDGAAAHGHRQRLRPQAPAGAAGTRQFLPLPRLVPPRLLAGVLDVEAGQLQAGAKADRAPAVPGVEGEQPRVELGKAAPAARAGSPGRIDVRGAGASAAVDLAHVQGAAAELQRLRHGGFHRRGGAPVDVEWRRPARRCRARESGPDAATARSPAAGRRPSAPRTPCRRPTPPSRCSSPCARSPAAPGPSPAGRRTDPGWRRRSRRRSAARSPSRTRDSAGRQAARTAAAESGRSR